MKLQRIKIAALMLLVLSSCATNSKIEKTITLDKLNYENFQNQEVDFELVEDVTLEVTIKGDTSSCGETTIEDEELLTIYVDFENITSGENQEFPLYVKYNDTVCEFEISPAKVTFDITDKHDYDSLQREYDFLKEMFEELSMLKADELQIKFTDVYSYLEDGKTEYISSFYGIEFSLNTVLPSEFSVKEDTKGNFGIFYSNGEVCEPVLVYTVLPIEMIESQEVVKIDDNGLAVIKSMAYFNGSSIGYEVWENEIHPFLDSLVIDFE